MSIAMRGLVAGSQTVASGNTTSAAVTLPADLKGQDDCILAIVFNPTTGSPTTGLTGWTQMGTDIVFNANNHAQLWHKTAAGTNGAASSDAGATVTLGGYGTQRIAAAVACMRAAGTFDIASQANGTDTTPFTTPAVTVANSAKANLLTFVMQRSSTPSTSITNSSGLTSVFSVGTGSGACSIAVGYNTTDVNNGSAIGATTWAQSPSAATGWIQVAIAVGARSNSAPTANAGSDQTVNMGATVTLDGSGSSDPDSGDTLTYAWSQTGGTSVTLSSSTAQKPTFTAPSSTTGTLTFSLTVTDNNGASSSADTVAIAVSDRAPTANAGPDQSAIEPFATVTLDGSASTDPDSGDTLTYAWTQTSGPTVTLSSSTAQKPTLTAPAPNGPATLVFSLVVTDSHGSSSTSDSVSIGVLTHTFFRIESGGPKGVLLSRL